MSHYTVMVIGDNPEEQLAPFQENNMGDCPQHLLTFHDMEGDMLKEYETKTVKMIELANGKRYFPWEKRFEVGTGIFDKKSEYPKGSKEVEVPLKDQYATFEKFAADYHGYKERDPKKHRFGYWENPNAKWDWHTLGGRWMGFFKLKNGADGELGHPGVGGNKADPGTADQARKGDIDFDAMEDEKAEAAGKVYDEAAKVIAGREWKSWASIRDEYGQNLDRARNVYHSQNVVKDWGKEKDLMWYNIEDFRQSREDYINAARNAAAVTFAVLKDQEWFERGSMGWWGAVSDEKDKDDWDQKVAQLLDELPDDTLLSVYDCHI